MKRRLTPAVLALVIGALANPGHADSWHRLAPDRDRYGEVLQVRPLYREVRVAVPDRRCRDAWYDAGEADGRDRAIAGAVVGGVLGGLVGSQVGSGDGRVVATVAGTAVGALIGHRIGHRIGEGLGEDGRRAHRCATLAHAETREEQAGYRVKYRYRGRIYHTETAHDPGEWIRVDGRLRPTHF